MNPYDWTEENIKLPETAVCHICHHINNPLAVLLSRIQQMPDSPDKETMIEAAERIRKYVKSLKSRIAA